MYANKLVAFLSVDGKILRDNDGAIHLPFGTEYSITLKNLESRNAVVKIWIDGQDVLDGNKLVVGPDDTIKLDGFMKGDSAINKFKFIEKTKRIEDYRGNKVSDGLIRIEFQFEKEKPIYRDIFYTEHYWYPNWIYYSPPPQPIKYYEPFWVTWTNGNSYTVNSSGNVKGSSSSQSFVGNNMSVSYSANLSDPQNEDGITVKGQQINQQFGTKWVNELEAAKHTIVLKLIGYRKGKKIKKPFTVKDSLVCEVCGEKNKYNSKYCSNCGNFLE